MVGGLRGRDTVVLILVSVFGVFVVAMYGWFVCCYAWVQVGCLIVVCIVCCFGCGSSGVIFFVVFAGFRWFALLL